MHEWVSHAPCMDTSCHTYGMRERETERERENIWEKMRARQRKWAREWESKREYVIAGVAKETCIYAAQFLQKSPVFVQHCFAAEPCILTALCCKSALTLCRIVDACHSQCTMGWRRLIGSPKLQIIFHKRATKYRALLLKMTYKDKATDDSTPPCTLIPCNKMYVSHQSENRGPWQKTACWTLRYREVFALQQTATDRNRLQHTY